MNLRWDGVRCALDLRSQEVSGETSHIFAYYANEIKLKLLTSYISPFS